MWLRRRQWTICLFLCESFIIFIATSSCVPYCLLYNALYTTENPPLPTSSMFLKLSPITTSVK
ncbi:20279_t:CDS:2 [Cetraspora pellucida]|uniref:20279_t:CDS:1 n=1 Tax=Cetraspora pellucida TaxID=1433469 RepID=A0A9N8VJ88_9GLOM|nr:20279_t:CDS:2 [Cetraspora pellucida]